MAHRRDNTLQQPASSYCIIALPGFTQAHLPDWTNNPSHFLLFSSLKTSNCQTIWGLKEFSSKPHQCSNHKHCLLRLCTSTCVSTSKLTAQINKLRPSPLLQNLPPDVHTTQNVDRNSRQPENPFRSFGVWILHISEQSPWKYSDEGGLWFETALLAIFYQNP